MALALTPLPAGSGIASRILRLPASALDKVLCLRDAAGLPVPLAVLANKADEDGRFRLLTPIDPAVPQSALTDLHKLRTPGYGL
jgi:hypothetical protein